MVKEFLLSLTCHLIKVNGRTIIPMGKVCSLGQMVPVMLASGNMEKLMEKDLKFGLMAHVTKETGKMIMLMAKAY